MMAGEAVKLICGIGEPLLGTLLVFDALGADWRRLRVKPDPQREPVTDLIDYEQFCGLSEPGPAVAEVDALTLAEMLADRAAGRRDFTLLDVREPYERDIVSIPGSVPMALAELLEALSGSVAEQRVPDGELVLYCKSGVRSARALSALDDAGRPGAVHLAGGVLAWIADVDPALPTY